MRCHDVGAMARWRHRKIEHVPRHHQGPPPADCQQGCGSQRGDGVRRAEPSAIPVSGTGASSRRALPCPLLPYRNAICRTFAVRVCSVPSAPPALLTCPTHGNSGVIRLLVCRFRPWLCRSNLCRGRALYAPVQTKHRVESASCVRQRRHSDRRSCTSTRTCSVCVCAGSRPFVFAWWASVAQTVRLPAVLPQRLLLHHRVVLLLWQDFDAVPERPTACEAYG